jgi:hypothetical protein
MYGTEQVQGFQFFPSLVIDDLPGMIPVSDGVCKKELHFPEK